MVGTWCRGSLLRCALAGVCLLCLSLGLAACCGEKEKEKDTTVEDAILALKSDDMDLRREASECLIEVGSAATGPLISLFEEGDPSLRREAAVILGVVGDPSAIGPLAERLDDPNADVRLAATWALVRLGSATVPALIESLGSERETVWVGAESALVRIGSPAVSTLIETLGSGNAALRRHCVRILATIGDPLCVEAINMFLEDEDGEVREEAALALKMVRPKESPNTDELPDESMDESF